MYKPYELIVSGWQPDNNFPREKKKKRMRRTHRGKSLSSHQASSIHPSFLFAPEVLFFI